MTKWNVNDAVAIRYGGIDHVRICRIVAVAEDGRAIAKKSDDFLLGPEQESPTWKKVGTFRRFLFWWRFVP